MSATFTISILAWDKALPLARPVREEVFVAEQKVRSSSNGTNGTSAAITRSLTTRADGDRDRALLPDGRIGRMAVLREWRRRGVALR